MVSPFISYPFSQAPRPSLDLFKAIFAESSDESAVSSDDEDTGSGKDDATTSAVNISRDPSATGSHYEANKKGGQWQDLSSVNKHLLDTSTKDLKISTPALLTNSVSQDNRGKERLSDTITEGASDKHQLDRPSESYGPSLPPGPGEYRYIEAPFLVCV